MTRDELKLEHAIKRFEKEYKKALENKWVIRPVAYALYQTWKYYDEKERKNVQSSE